MSDNASAATVLCVGIVSFFAVIAVMVISSSDPDQIGIECVKAGNQWVKRGAIYECIK